VGGIYVGGGVDEGGGVDGTKEVGGSNGNISATEDDDEGVQLVIRSGAKRCWRAGPGDGDKLLST
jgi:hypothetical protein